MKGIENVSVTYLVVEGGKLSDASIAFENAAFSVAVSDGKAVFTFKEEVPSVDEAERRIHEYLCSWCADELLQRGLVGREFRMHAVHDERTQYRAYSPPWSVRISGPKAEANTRRYYPWRRHRYFEQPLVASLIERYEDYRRGRERITVLGFLVLSALRSVFGGPKVLQRECRIHSRVLHQLGRLVSTIGTYSTARKIGSGHECGIFRRRRLSGWREPLMNSSGEPGTSSSASGRRQNYRWTIYPVSKQPPNHANRADRNSLLAALAALFRPLIRATLAGQGTCSVVE